MAHATSVTVRNQTGRPIHRQTPLAISVLSAEQQHTNTLEKIVRLLGR